MRRTVGSAIVLSALLGVAWLLWSGIYKPLLLALGAFSVGLSVYLAYRVGFFHRPTGLHVMPKLPRYWLWLLWEIGRSSIEVSRIVLHPKLPISPKLIGLDADPEGPIGQVILGNAITLSPGTVTLDLYEGHLLVHCLTEASAHDLVHGMGNHNAAKLTKG